MQTQDIKRRIKSVQSTQQITRAMKFVAAAKLRRSQERMLAMRPYANALDGLLKHVARDLIGDEHPLFRKRPEVKRAAIIVVAGDRGLAGGFNSSILKAAREFVRGKPGVEPVFYAIGKRAASALAKTHGGVKKSYVDVFEKMSYVLIGEICDELVALFTAKEGERIDEAYVVYNEFVSVLAQKPTIKKLLPVDFKSYLPKQEEEDSGLGLDDESQGKIIEETVMEHSPDDIFDEEDQEEELLAEEGEKAAAAAPGGPPRPIYELMPSPEAALARLVARRLATEVYRGALESYAAELSARMNAMDNATSNADEMISHLTTIYNRARQNGITTELMDIIGGANALG